MKLSVRAILFASAVSLCLSPVGVSRADYFTTTVDINGGSLTGLQRFDEATGVRLTEGEVAPASVGSPQPYGPFAPTDLTVGPDGNVYVSDAAGTILRFDSMTGAPTPGLGPAPDGLFTARPSQALGLTFTSLTFDSTGDLYVLDAYDVSGTSDTNDLRPGVRVYDAFGQEVDTLLESEAAGTFLSPSSAIFDSTGNLLISDRDAATIYSVDVDTDTLSVFKAAEELAGVAGMAVGPDGDVYVANLFFNNILRIESDGSSITTFASLPPVTFDPFSNFPSDLVFDSEGNLVVAVLGWDNVDPETNTAEGMILKYDSTGSLIQTVASGLLPTSSVAIVEDLLPGDFNGDGIVDDGDYTVWKAEFGTSVAATSGADGNGDGVVDAADYTVWRNSLGAVGISTASTVGFLQNVPEPSSLGLLLIVGGLISAARFRKA